MLIMDSFLQYILVEIERMWPHHMYIEVIFRNGYKDPGLIDEMLWRGITSQKKEFRYTQEMTFLTVSSKLISYNHPCCHA
jgi:hypothetical protein